MKPYIATCTSGLRVLMTEQEALDAITAAFAAEDPYGSDLQTARLEARGWLHALNDGSESEVGFEHFTLTPNKEVVWWLLVFNTLAAGFLLSAVWCMASGRFNEAAYMFMGGSFYGLLLLYVHREITRPDRGIERG